MKFYLADNSTPYNTIFRLEDGQPAYRTAVLKKSFSGGSTVGVWKVPLGQGVFVHPHQREGAVAGTIEYALATMKIRMFHPDEFVYNGREFSEGDFFKKGALGHFGRHRLWIGPDGKEYKWDMGASKPELYLNDHSRTLIARFHRPHSGFGGFHEARPGCLELFGPLFEELVDIILVTFVYMEKYRADREKEAVEAASHNIGVAVDAGSSS